MTDTTKALEVMDLTLRQLHERFGAPGAPEAPAEVREYLDLYPKLQELIALRAENDRRESELPPEARARSRAFRREIEALIHEAFRSRISRTEEHP
jgi:hypothetical protein